LLAKRGIDPEIYADRVSAGSPTLATQ
jgi:hypothetical protein